MTVNKFLLVLSSLVFGSSLFATHCPLVRAYTVSSHNANNTRCEYRSNSASTLNIRGQQLLKPQCPRFWLTDPHFRLVHCSHNVALARCVCSIVSN
jgi:hypothetical protein